MAKLTEQVVGSTYALAKRVVVFSGLHRRSWGKKLLVALNILGNWLTRGLLSRRQDSLVEGHHLALANSRGPSLSFSTNLLLGRYEPEIRDLLHFQLHEGMIVLDVGAHVGYYSLLAAKLVGPKGKVYAFEPEPENFKILQANVASNGYENISLVHQAVGDRTGRVQFFLSRQGNDRHSIFLSNRESPRETCLDVPAVSLDDFFAEQGWPHVDLIKMDIEGAEPLALKGMTQLIARSENLRMIVELAPDALRAGGFEAAEFLDQLAAAGFHLYVPSPNGMLTALSPADFMSFAQNLEKLGVLNLFCEKNPAQTEESPRPAAGMTQVLTNLGSRSPRDGA